MGKDPRESGSPGPELMGNREKLKKLATHQLRPLSFSLKMKGKPYEDIT